MNKPDFEAQLAVLVAVPMTLMEVKLVGTLLKEREDAGVRTEDVAELLGCDLDRANRILDAFVKVNLAGHYHYSEHFKGKKVLCP